MRRSGMLLPISSIPSRYGIGSFSKEAYEFVDFLEEAGQSLWQILPLGPTGYGDSPYQSVSTFAGNPYFIDLEQLIEAGWLTEEECEACDFVGHENYVDYERMYRKRFALLRKAFEASGIETDPAYQEFVQENAFWLDDYALYMAIKDALKGAGLLTWEDKLRSRDPETMAQCRVEYAEDIAFYKFQQFLFDVQWSALKAYANEKGILIVGDIPIYVALDSADTWANPELLQLEEDGTPTAVAGCPPDAFSATGQLWGNPLYRWEYHKQTGYDWWMKRIGFCYRRYDVLRIDHFRGFEAYYSIPYGEETAANGHWEKGPGYDFFRVMKEKLGEKEVIAEDLGYLTQEVLDMVAKTGYPGMKVLQFAFDPSGESSYLPHKYDKNCVVYTGTHDNHTNVGWLEDCSEEEKEFVAAYLDAKSEKEIPYLMVRAAMSSVADTAIVPIQDWLEKGRECRMNLPSTLGDNWKWRLSAGECGEELAAHIRRMTKLYGRLVQRAEAAEVSEDMTETENCTITISDQIKK